MATESELARRTEDVKAQLLGLGELRPGKLSEQYNVCGTPGCRCKADPPQKHGPYYQLSYTRKGKSRTEAVAPERLAEVRSQTEAYQRLQGLVDEWVGASIELERLRRPARARAAPNRRRA
jgi:hypothetical protein